MCLADRPRQWYRIARVVLLSGGRASGKARAAPQSGMLERAQSNGPKIAKLFTSMIGSRKNLRFTFLSMFEVGRKTKKIWAIAYLLCI